MVYKCSEDQTRSPSSFPPPLRLTAGAFGLGTWVIKGKDSGLEFFAGYIVEQSLSVDNLFIFIMLFDYFKVPAEFQVKHAAFWVACGRVALVMDVVVVVVVVPHLVCWRYGIHHNHRAIIGVSHELASYVA